MRICTKVMKPAFLLILLSSSHLYCQSTATKQYIYFSDRVVAVEGLAAGSVCLNGTWYINDAATIAW